MSDSWLHDGHDRKVENELERRRRDDEREETYVEYLARLLGAPVDRALELTERMARDI